MESRLLWSLQRVGSHNIWRLHHHIAQQWLQEKGSSFKLRQIHGMKWEWLEAVYKCLDEWGQRWLKENPKYNGPLRLDAWMQSCHQCLMHLKVCSFFLLFCEVRTLGVFQIHMSRVWGSGMAQKAWSLEGVIPDMLGECSPFHQWLPFTFHDTILIVMLFQHVCLNTLAMLEYLETPLSAPSGDFVPAFGHWMGEFTLDFDDCQCLFESRIPVWLIQKWSMVLNDINVHKIVKTTCPLGIVTEPQEFCVGHILKWDSWQYYARESWHWQTWCSPTVGLKQFVPPPGDNINNTDSSVGGQWDLVQVLSNVRVCLPTLRSCTVHKFNISDLTR